MRLPYLQVDGDFLAHRARAAAVLLDCSRAQAVGHVSLLWSWAVSSASGDAPPNGHVPGTRAGQLVAAVAEWTGDPAVFVQALAHPTVALLEVLPDGLRVRGLDRYAVAWERQEKERARKADWRRTRASRPQDVPGAGCGTSVKNDGDGARQTQTEIKTQTHRKEDPPKAPRGAREPREGDPCEPCDPPASTPPAAHLADASFHAEPAPPQPGVWDLHTAVQVAYEMVRHKKRYPWNPAGERKAIQALWGLCAASGIADPQAQVQEVAKRFARGLACADDGKGRAPFVRCCTTLTGLAKPECWAGNDVPFVEQREVRDAGGVRRVEERALEPWDYAVWRAAA